MPNTEEQRLDVMENCNALLQGVLRPFRQTDDTPEGRMIAQLKWLKEHAETHALNLPVRQAMLSTLLHVYTEGELCRHASAPGRCHTEIEIHLDRLVQLTREARLLLKREYYPYAIRCIEALLGVLRRSARPLSQHERGAIDELLLLRDLLGAARIEPPVGGYLPDYPNLRKVYRITYSSVDDLPDGKYLCQTVNELIFEGVRPDSWVTPAAADKATGNL